MEKWYRTFLKRWEQAAEQKDSQERERMFAELESHPRFAEFRELVAAKVGNSLKRILAKASQKMEQGEQQPNFARSILAIMDELKGMDYWDGAENTTYKEALNTLEAYKKLEKKRGAYLAMKSAYQAAIEEYKAASIFLTINIEAKHGQSLMNLSEGSADYMKWYSTATGLIALCHNQEIDITLPTLRKYQSLGLIPKPIRLGRYSYYSLLTFIRLGIIQEMKRRGLKLKDMEGTIEAYLKWMVEELEKRTLPMLEPSIEKAVRKMALLTYEDFMEGPMGWGGFIEISKRRAKDDLKPEKQDGNNNAE